MYSMGSMSPDEQFTVAFSRMTRGWATVDSFRRIGFAGIPYAAEIVAQEHSSLIADLTATGKLSEFIIGITSSEDLQKTGDWLRQRLTEQAVKNAACSIDAASLVFAHTILDDGLSAFLKTSSDVAPAYWQKRIEKKNVSIALLNGHSCDEILRSVVAKELEGIRRNASLIEKCDLLHGVCKPSKGTPVHPEYKFDVATLSEVDKLRQQLVHGDLLGEEISDAPKKLEYLRQTWMYFFVMMHQSFGLRIDPAMLSRPRS